MGPRRKGERSRAQKTRREPGGRAQSGAGPAAGTRRGKRWRGPLALALALVIVAGASAFWLARFVRAPRAQRVGGASGAADGLTVPEAYARAIELAKQERYRQCLPYYEAAVAWVRSDFWELHFNYGAALLNLTLQYGERGPHPVAATRSSVERVMLVREGIRQLSRAAELAPAGAARARVLGERANAFAVWGFPWESLVSLREAQEADPGQPEIKRQADALLQLILNPPPTVEPRSSHARRVPPRALP